MANLTEHTTLRGMLIVPLADDIMDAGCGKFAHEGHNGELIRESDSRIDVWGRGDGNGHYDHYYYNGPDDYGKAPDGRHD